MVKTLDIELNELQGVFDDVNDSYVVADYTQPLREEVIPLLSAEHEEYFNQEAGPLGAWKPLAPVTARRKGFDTILIEFNTMRSSLLFQGPKHIDDVTPRSLDWGTSDEKAAIHQHGTKNIPERPFVGTQVKTLDAIETIIGDALVEILKK